MSAASAMPVVAALVFAGAGTAAAATIAAMVMPQWRRIARLAAGHTETLEPVDRWRRVHIEADRRQPYLSNGARTSRLGALNGWAR